MGIKRADRPAVFSRLFGNNIQRAREMVAACLIRLHVAPNTLTILGLLATAVAAVFLALGAGDRIGSGPGRSWYPLYAGLTIILAAAFDMLDGAVARNAGQATRMGAFLDSCLDRIADALIFGGILFYYVRNPQVPHHQWFVLAALVAFTNAELISYLKARAENFIAACPVGYWQRGERIAAIFIGVFAGHIGTVMVQLAVLSAFTVVHRLVFAARQIRRAETGRPALEPGPPCRGWGRLQIWRYPRGSLPYDIATAANIAFILFVDLQRMN